MAGIDHKIKLIDKRLRELVKEKEKDLAPIQKKIAEMNYVVNKVENKEKSQSSFARYYLGIGDPHDVPLTAEQKQWYEDRDHIFSHWYAKRQEVNKLYGDAIEILKIKRKLLVKSLKEFRRVDDFDLTNMAVEDWKQKKQMSQLSSRDKMEKMPKRRNLPSAASASFSSPKELSAAERRDEEAEEDRLALIKILISSTESKKPKEGRGSPQTVFTESDSDSDSSSEPARPAASSASKPSFSSVSRTAAGRPSPLSRLHFGIDPEKMVSDLHTVSDTESDTELKYLKYKMKYLQLKQKLGL